MPGQATFATMLLTGQSGTLMSFTWLLSNAFHRSFPALPYIREYVRPRHATPATVLPRVTGSRLLVRNWVKETLAPRAMPRGTMNMLATECSNPRATKALMGNQIATALPAALLQALAIHTAAHTSQLHRIPRENACTISK